MSNNELIINKNIELVNDSDTHTKIVINSCFGGFGLSLVGIERYAEYKGIKLVSEKNGPFTQYYSEHSNGKRDYFNDSDIERDDPALIRVVEDLGKRAQTAYSDLQIRSLKKGTLYRIDDYDGREHIETVETIDWKVA
jgi:hypothetical protein